MRFMKKNYVSPEIQEIEISMETPMLAASEGGSEYIPINPNEPGDPTAKEHTIIDVWE